MCSYKYSFRGQLYTFNLVGTLYYQSVGTRKVPQLKKYIEYKGLGASAYNALIIART